MFLDPENKRHNLSANRTARKLRLRVPSALRAPAAGNLKRSTLTFEAHNG